MKGMALGSVIRTVSIMISVIMLISLSLGLAYSIGPKVRLETIDVVSQRFEGAVYMTSGLERGRTQLNMKDEYGLEKEDGTVYVNYTAEIPLSILEEEARREIESPVEFRTVEGTSENFCIVRKPGDIVLRTGEC